MATCWEWIIKDNQRQSCFGDGDDKKDRKTKQSCSEDRGDREKEEDQKQHSNEQSSLKEERSPLTTRKQLNGPLEIERDAGESCRMCHGWLWMIMMMKDETLCGRRDIRKIWDSITEKTKLVLVSGAGIMEADDRQVKTVFTVQPSFHHRGRNSSLVVLGLAVHSVAGSILLWGNFPVQGIFPLELTWVQTPFPPKLFRMRV